MLDRGKSERRIRVDSGSHRRAAERKFSKRVLQLLQSSNSELNLARVASKLLAEPHRSSILKVRSSNLHDRIEFLRLHLERGLKLPQGGDERPLDRLQGCNV